MTVNDHEKPIYVNKVTGAFTILLRDLSSEIINVKFAELAFDKARARPWVIINPAEGMIVWLMLI